MLPVNRDCRSGQNQVKARTGQETWCLTSTETVRLIRDGERPGQPSVAIYNPDIEAQEPAQELRESPDGPGLPAPNKPYGFCGRKAP